MTYLFYDCFDHTNKKNTNYPSITLYLAYYEHRIPQPSIDDPDDDDVLNLNDTKFHDFLSHIDPVDPIDYLIYIPYAIAGAITVFSALIVLGLYYYKKYEPPTKVRRSQEMKSDKSGVAMLENGMCYSS